MVPDPFPSTITISERSRSATLVVSVTKLQRDRHYYTCSGGCLTLWDCTGSNTRSQIATNLSSLPHKHGSIANPICGPITLHPTALPTHPLTRQQLLFPGPHYPPFHSRLLRTEHQLVAQKRLHGPRRYPTAIPHPHSVHKRLREVEIRAPVAP